MIEAAKSRFLAGRCGIARNRAAIVSPKQSEGHGWLLIDEGRDANLLLSKGGNDSE